MARLPLDDIRLATPCHQDWTEMVGDERVRYCARCELNVFNITAMTRTAAQVLINDAEGRVCVRFYRRRDGTILTRDCRAGHPSELVELARAGVRLGALGALIAAVAAVPHLLGLSIERA